MCLAVPGLVKSVDGRIAIVDFGGVNRQIALDVLPDTHTGDYILAHAGFALQKLEEQEALELFALFRELDDTLEQDSENQS